MNGFKLLADPWLTDGAFCGSWFHYPPLITDFAFVKDVDAIYISHLHPDHYDEETLKQFRKDIAMIVLDHGANFLHKKLEALGFTNLIKVKDKQTVTVGPLEITLYAPFVNHPFDNSDLGNFLDSAMVVEANGKVILNANDNTPTVDSARQLKERHGPFTVAQLKDSLAGAYPSCFVNLTSDQKLADCQRLIKRQLLAMCEVAKELEAEWFQPFAGDYQLAGKLVPKNKYLGVAGKKFSAEFIASRGLRPLILNEQGSIDLISGELKNTYRKNIEPYDKWCQRVSKISFEWEGDPEPNPVEIRNLAFEARDNLWKWQEKLNFKSDYTILLKLQNDNPPTYYQFNLKDYEKQSYILGEGDFDENDLACFMDSRLLLKILKRELHWNNADVGCHIDYIRKGLYNPDIHMIMSFFHL